MGLTAFRERWFVVFSGELSWPDFCARCEEFAAEARDLVRQLRTRSTPGNSNNPAPPPPPPRRRPAAGRPIPPFYPVAAKRIQGLYQHSKKRAARKLLCDNSVTYTGSVQAASDYFVSVLEEKHANMNVLADEWTFNLLTPSPHCIMVVGYFFHSNRNGRHETKCFRMFRLHRFSAVYKLSIPHLTLWLTRGCVPLCFC